MSDETELAQVQLVNRNCKNSEFHIQLLSDVALPETGHVLMFEAISLGYPLNNYLSDGTLYKIEHTLTCDVDICLKTRTGNKNMKKLFRQMNFKVTMHGRHVINPVLATDLLIEELKKKAFLSSQQPKLL